MDAASEQRRLAYLERLGIDVWVPRAALAGGPALAEAVAAAKTTPVPLPGVAQVLPQQPVARPQPETAAPAGAAEGWDELRMRVAACQACALCDTRTQTVFGVGDTRSPVMVIGEAPGAEEDRQGEPFVGPAGQLLNAMLQAMGWPRERVYIANILKCRPQHNRDPLPQEVAACEPFLKAQIERVAPRVIIAVGRIAAQNLLKSEQPLARLRGVVHRYGDTPVVVTYHPAYLLRSPGEKRKAWQDLKVARTLIEREAPR